MTATFLLVIHAAFSPTAKCQELQEVSNEVLEFVYEGDVTGVLKLNGKPPLLKVAPGDQVELEIEGPPSPDTISARVGYDWTWVTERKKKARGWRGWFGGKRIIKSTHHQTEQLDQKIGKFGTSLKLVGEHVGSVKPENKISLLEAGELHRTHTSLPPGEMELKVMVNVEDLPKSTSPRPSFIPGGAKGIKCKNKDEPNVLLAGASGTFLAQSVTVFAPPKFEVKIRVIVRRVK